MAFSFKYVNALCVYARTHEVYATYVQDVSEVSVETVEDVLSVLWQGARNRAISATDMNEYSSRSHTIFTVVVEQTPSAASSEAADGAKLTIRSKVCAVLHGAANFDLVDRDCVCVCVYVCARVRRSTL